MRDFVSEATPAAKGRAVGASFALTSIRRVMVQQGASGSTL